MKLQPRDRQEIARIARQIRAGEIGLVLGCRLLARRFGRPDEEEYRNLMLPFVAIESETEHYPDEGLRKAWNPESLAKLDQRIQGYEERIRPQVNELCDALIQLGQDARLSDLNPTGSRYG